MSFLDLIQKASASFNLDEFFDFLSASEHTCLFVKNEHSNYCFANDNYIQLMGLKSRGHLLSLTDYEISKNRKDAELYREHDRYIIEEGKILSVNEVIAPQYNQPIVKTMQGKLYPLCVQSDKANYVLGVVVPESKLLKLDFNTLFRLTQHELSELLVKRSYVVNLQVGTITLSKMEIRTIVPLLKGAHAGQIAQELQIKQTTVESYLINIKDKLAANSKSELISRVINEKLLEQIVL